MTSEEAPPINDVSPTSADPMSQEVSKSPRKCLSPVRRPMGCEKRHTLSFLPIPPRNLQFHGLSALRGCDALGSPLSQENQFHVSGLISRTLLEECNKNHRSSPMSVSSYSTAQSSDFNCGSPMGCVVADESSQRRKSFDQASMVSVPPEFSVRMAKALHTMKSCADSSSAFRSAPCSPASQRCGVFASPAFLRKSSDSFIRSDLRALGADSDPCMDEEMVPEEVHILLAQMNSSSLAVNQCENQLRVVRHFIAQLDSDWKTTRERLMGNIGANHIQRADPFYTKLREIRHRKDFCTKLAQKYAHLSTLADQISVKEAKSDREMRWLQMRIEKADKLKTAIEKQMAASTENVAKLQQELSAQGQEHAISVRKAESFFLGYSSYLDNRKKSMQEQKGVEEKVVQNKDLYKAAMDGLESLSRQIHQERGTLANARKSVA